MTIPRTIPLLTLILGLAAGTAARAQQSRVVEVTLTPESILAVEVHALEGTVTLVPHEGTAIDVCLKGRPGSPPSLGVEGFMNLLRQCTEMRCTALEPSALDRKNGAGLQATRFSFAIPGPLPPKP